MAYDFIPKSLNEISKESIFKNEEYGRVYTYLSEKFRRDDPIALSKNPNEMKNIKITRALQGTIELRTIKDFLRIKDVKLSFGEGSRGGRGTQNKGGQFELDFTQDLKTWWEGNNNYINASSEKIINEMAQHYKWDKKKTFEVDNVGGLNQRRPLVFAGKNVYIGTGSDPNIGATVTDITINADGKKVYLSLKATGTVTFFNAGVATILTPQDMKLNKTITNQKGLALLKVLGLDPVKFANVFNDAASNKPIRRYSEDITRSIDRISMIKLLQSGIGYGFHYVHAKKPTEIHHFEMSKQKMTSLANPGKCIAYYGGKTSAGKRVEVEVDTPNILLKFNIRNKQGGVYPSHIMCDYVFKKY
jgi:hypothetical protein